MVDISKLTTVKILDKRSNAYECELEPLWLAADLVEKTRMGRVCIRCYENGLVRAGRLAVANRSEPATWPISAFGPLAPSRLGCVTT
jgi:hypothetical protein